MNIKCMARIRVGRPLYEPTNSRGVLEYCPKCGSKAGAKLDLEENYIEVLAESYGMSVELLQQIMSLWNATDVQNLSDFIDQLKAEALNNKNKEALAV